MQEILKGLEHEVNMKIVRSNIKENTNAQHYLSYETRITKWLVDSSHKSSVMLKAFPCHDVFADAGKQSGGKQQ